MDTGTQGYVAFVVMGAALVVVVGQLLIHSGRVYLEEVFPDDRVAGSVSKLLAVLFYLFALGLLAVISTIDVPVDGEVQTVVTKLGVVMIVLGIVFGATMMVLNRIRQRREEETLLSEVHGMPVPGGSPAVSAAVPGHGTPGAPGTPTVGGVQGAAGTTGRIDSPAPAPPPGTTSTTAAPGTDARFIGPA